MSNANRKRTALDALLKPESVAIIGASDNPNRIGGRPIRYCKAAGYTGTIHAVNPNHDQAQGLPCHRHIDEIPGQVDLAVIAVSADKTVASVEACARKGVRAAVIFSAGFAETGAAGEEAQRALTDISRSSSMRILGPNCLGVYNASNGFFATFTSTLENGFPSPAGVALVSQSGAYGSHVSLLAHQRGIGVRYWVTTGNECDIELAECIAYMVEDPDISVIVAYAEGIRDRDLLLESLRLARANHKPVIFMKVGRSPIGAQAAASHTAALAGTDAVYDAVLRQFGAYRAGDTEELLDVAYACSLGVRPKGSRLGLLTISGGVGIQMADAAADTDLHVAAMPESGQERMKALLPYAATRNPVDTTAQVFNDPGLIDAYLDIMLDQGRYDVVIAFFTFVAAADSMLEPVGTAIEKAHEAYPDRLIVLVIVAPEDVVRHYEDAGCLVFEDPTRAVRAVAALHAIESGFAQQGPPARGQVEITSAALTGEPVNEMQAKQILAAAGIAVVEERLVASADEAAVAAEELGFPVAMKIVSADIPHKTEVDGVRLRVDSPDRARSEFDDLMTTVAARCPKARLEGILVSPMVTGGVETVLGIHRDPLFGPVIMFGLGGIFVEVLEDVSFRLAPFDEQEAERMVREVRGFPLLAGTRGKGPYDVKALCRALASLSRFAAANAEGIESADVNPFLVLPDGHGARALDALIVPRGSDL
jgi:acyl-CoA synthetase (NDP forming)